jgi:branched-chain amino acid transport system permease protein
MWVNVGIGLCLVLLALLAPRVLTLYHVTFLLQVCMMIGLAQAWNLISGLTGYVSFGHAVFFGIGAYSGALLLLHGVPWWLCTASAAWIAMFLALPVGLLTLRLQGPYFAIAMLGLNEVGRITATLWVSRTQGGDGITLTPALLPQLLSMYYTTCFLAVMATVVIAVVLRSRCGLDLRAIREDEGAAEMLGVNTRRNKIVAFVASAVIPGAIGAIYAMYTSYIDPLSTFPAALNIEMIVIVLLGGRGTVGGPVLGAILIMSIREFTWAQFPGLHLALLGVLLIVVVLYLPDGLLMLTHQRKRIRPGQCPQKVVRTLDGTF